MMEMFYIFTVSGGYMGIYMCQNSLNYTLIMSAFYFM